MGKIDDMRRQREQQFADGERRQAKAPPAARPVEVVVPPVRAAAPVAQDKEPSQPTRPTSTKKQASSRSGGAVDEQGKCPDCGKTKPVSNGLMANHQKGFGKACAGSRKKPV